MGVFYLGLHEPSWLAKVQVPVFMSHRRLRRLVALPRATCAWCLDSGGFMEVGKMGRWTEPARAFARAVRRYQEFIGGLQWAAIQDWMCEPEVRAVSGMTTQQHQIATTWSYLALMDAAPDLPWAPVLQGQRPHDYETHLELYDRWDIDLNRAPATIGMRMLEPKELAKAMGFPDDFKWVDGEGKPLTKRDTIKMIGNACPVNTVAALVKTVVMARPHIYRHTAA